MKDIKGNIKIDYSKNGFTLVELVLSITLLSIVLIFMMSMLLALKDKEASNGADAKMLVNQAIISKAVNGDILNHGLESVNPCSSSNCYILTFSNGDEKTLKLMSNNQTLFYGSEKQTDFVRTLPSGRTYSSIHYYMYSNLEIIRVSVSKIYRNEDYDVEIYNYMGNKKTSTGTYASGGLILHYDALNNAGSSHNPVSSMWVDVSNTGNSSTLYGMSPNAPVSYSGWIENALVLDGDNDGLSLGNILADLYKSSFTIEFVVSKANLDKEDILMSNCNESHCNSILIDENNKNKITIDGDTFAGLSEEAIFGENDIDVPVTLSYSFDKTNGKISTYVNGVNNTVIESSALSNYDYSFNDVYIGRSKDNITGAFEGKIYSVRIYSHALNNVKIKENAKVDRTRFINQIIYVPETSGEAVGNEFIPPLNGYYKIELWGARGGNITRVETTYEGGGGGYTSGIINLKTTDKLYFYVGSKPGDTNATSSTSGVNGGGAVNSGSESIGRGGGGATDMRLVGGAYDNDDSLRSRIMVAGGGGGANFKGSGYGEGNGGAGGGIEGKDGISTNFTSQNFCHKIGGGASQNIGGTTRQFAGTGCEDDNSITGSFGIGGSGEESGGGGGYYGGGSSSSGGAGGGSSYISGHAGCVAVSSAYSNTPLTGCEAKTSTKSCSIHYSRKVFSDTVMIDGDGNDWTNISNTTRLMPGRDGSYYPSGVGNRGDGMVRITYLGDKKQ